MQDRGQGAGPEESVPTDGVFPWAFYQHGPRDLHVAVLKLEELPRKPESALARV